MTAVADWRVWAGIVGALGVVVAVVGFLVWCWKVSFRGAKGDATPENDLAIRRRINESEAIRALAHRRLMEQTRKRS